MASEDLARRSLPWARRCAASSAALSLLCSGSLALAQAPAGGAPPAPAPAGPEPLGPGELTANAQTTGATVTAGTTPPTEARDLSVQRPVTKPWQVLGEAQYRTLVVRDEDPGNDQRMIYRLGFNYAVQPQLILSARGGVQQRFVAEPDESGLRLEDMALSALLLQSVDLAPLGWDRKLSLIHRLRFYLPTSRRSQQDDLYFATEWMSRARVRMTAQSLQVSSAYFSTTPSTTRNRWGPAAKRCHAWSPKGSASSNIRRSYRRHWAP